MEDIVIVSAARTAVGKFGGSLAKVAAPDLGAAVIREAIARAKIDAAQVGEVIMGQVLAAGSGQNPARQAVIKSGLPDMVPGITINKVCGSGLKATHLAAQAILCGDADIIIAGGLTAETFTAADNVTVEVCGYRFISGDLQIVSGNLVTATKDLTTLGLASGQTCWLGGTTSGTSFATAADRGPFRIALAPAANLITTDKRYGSWTDDAGTGKTVDLYFGRQLRVVPITDANYLERHIRWETTYHRLGAANAPAYGYTVGCAISQATLTLPEKDLATMALEFMANSEIAPSTSRATNASAPFRETKKAAISTVSDVFRGRVLKVDPSTGAVGAGLTGYITAVNLTLKNNTSYNGAHGVQGSFETSFGMLEADLKVNAYFTEIDAVSHANSNLPVTADWFLRNNDGAFCMDVPYAELAIDGRTFVKDQTIKIDLGVGACEDSIWGTSLIVSLLPYCPAA